MIREVVQFVLEACRRTRMPLSLNFYPANAQGDKFSIFSINFKGRSVLNFTNKNFADIPKAKRFKEFLPLVKVGLNHNLGELSMREQIEIPRRMGLSLVRHGKLLKKEYA